MHAQNIIQNSKKVARNFS